MAYLVSTTRFDWKVCAYPYPKLLNSFIKFDVLSYGILSVHFSWLLVREVSPVCLRAGQANVVQKVS